MRDARLLPGPLQAHELAANEAALAGPSRTGGMTKTRLVIGTAAVAAAVTVPNISVGAVDAPILRLGVSEPEPLALKEIWTPSIGSSSPVYASALAAEEIAPTALTFTSLSRFEQDGNPLPLEFLETGSERFDLAFAGVAVPTVSSITPPSFAVAPGLPDQQRGEFGASANPLRAALIDVEQISGLRPALPRAQAPREHPVVRGRPSLAPVRQGNGRLAIANEAVEAAFAGQLDVSGEVRTALPIASRPSRGGDETARIVPIPQADASLTSAREEQVELVQKTRLDARVNGVLTGTVEFEQRGATIAVRLGSVVDMLSNRFSAEELASLRSGRGANTYLTLAELQEAGIPISYSPAYDEIEFGIDYNDAPEAAKVQVEQIGAPTAASESVMIDQIPR